MTIEEKAKEYAKDKDIWNFSDEVFQMNVDAFIAGAKEALSSQWISVKDELPKDGEEVIVAYYDTFFEAQFSKGDGHHSRDHFTRRWESLNDHETYYLKDGIRYWMRKPELPDK